MPLEEIQASSKEELIKKIMEHEVSKGKSQEQALAIAYAEAKRRGYKDMGFIHETMKDAVGKATRLNNVLKVPVTLVAEMVQDYHISELPWLKSKVGKDVTRVRVFKPYEELVKAFQDLQERQIEQIPFVVPHSKGTFLKSQSPKGTEWITDWIEDLEVKGYVKDFYMDEVGRKLKGWAYLTISKNDLEFIKDIESGKIVDVSIGFLCDFDAGGVFKDETYTLTQRNIQIGHLAGLPHARGKCPSGICGLNQDVQKEFTMDLTSVEYLNSSPHIAQFYSVMTDVEKMNSADPIVEISPKIPINPSDINQINGDVVMTPEEEKLLRQQIADLQKQNADLQISATIAKQVADIQKEVADWKVKFEAMKSLKDAAEEMQKKCGEEVKAKDVEIEKLKNTQKKDGLISKLKPKFGDRLIGGKKLEDHCVHDLELLANVAQVEADQSLADQGMPKGTEADHIKKLTGNNDKSETKTQSTAISPEDMRNLRKEDK